MIPQHESHAPAAQTGGYSYVLVNNKRIFNARVALPRKTESQYLFLRQAFLSGLDAQNTMEVLEDADAKEMIWRDGDTMYYPGGVSDPDYCVLKFTAQSGRYYSNFKSEEFEAST